MKAFFLGSVASLGLALALDAQTPTPGSESPSATPTASVSYSPSATPIPVASPTPAATASANTFADDIKRRAERGFHGKSNKSERKHGITIDTDDSSFSTDAGVPGWVGAVAVLSIIAVFGFPVAIVAVIMIVNWAKTRSLHRTVREMVAKGQPVPPELLTSRAGAPLRPWYDLRRGIILLAVGVGIMFFFLAVAGWEAGVWAFGLIPAIIGASYILTWRLANKQGNGVKL